MHSLPQRGAPTSFVPQPAVVPNSYYSQQLAQSSEHTDVIHDVQFDYYGQLLATASSDRTIGIYEVSGESVSARKAVLSGHKGPVWMVSWANPRFGKVLASAGYDRKAIIWKEKANKEWIPLHLVDVHQGSVNAVNWAPHQYGAMLSSCSSDGSVAVTVFENGCWQKSIKLSNNSNNIAHAMGATSVSFAPYVSSLPHSIFLVSGGCDKQVRLWHSSRNEASGIHFTLLSAVNYPSKITDVAFSPFCGGSRFAVVAVCHGSTVVIQRKLWEFLSPTDSEARDSNSWECSSVSLKDAAWRLSWSPCGELLVVTTVTSQAFVLREGALFTDPWILQPVSG